MKCRSNLEDKLFGTVIAIAVMVACLGAMVSPGAGFEFFALVLAVPACVCYALGGFTYLLEKREHEDHSGQRNASLQRTG